MCEYASSVEARVDAKGSDEEDPNGLCLWKPVLPMFMEAFDSYWTAGRIVIL
jgi:hypothetical protein